MSLLTEIAPADLGLPPKFRDYRPTQADAIEFALNSDSGIVGACAPTGIGKSLVGVTTGLAAGLKTVYLTATKGLQDQIMHDFAPCGMTDIRGVANYPCRVYTKELRRAMSCEYGQENKCSNAKTLHCPYTAAIERAKDSQLVATNYAYWLHSRRHNSFALERDGTPVGLLVCDEAHDAFEQLASFLAVRLSKEDIAGCDLAGSSSNGLMTEPSGRRWAKWAEAEVRDITIRLNELKRVNLIRGTLAQPEEKHGELEERKKKLSAILSMDGNWVWEANDSGVSFDCIWPGRYSQFLWSGVERVLLLSATLRPYTLKLLGLARENYDFREFSNGWPPNRGNVYFLPTAKLSYKSSDEDYAHVVRRIDEIIDSRIDRKGIVHTVSYSRMRKLLSLSRHSRSMLFNSSAADAVSIASRFRKSKAPAILVSPSFGTGWDFSYDQCEYQIIPKVPFPFAESRVMKERVKDDQYRVYCAMLEIIQMVGRGRRAPDDRCETFILDSNYAMVSNMGKAHAGSNFKTQKVIVVPEKPQKI